MRRGKPLLCALARYVHKQCRLPLAPEAFSQPADVGTARGLSAAVGRHQPAVLPGLVPSALLGAAVPRLRELCGHREVSVRLPARASDGTGVVFGDPTKQAPYERTSCPMAEVIDEYLAGASAPRQYLACTSIEEDLPEFAEYLAPLQEIVESLTAPQVAVAFGPRVPGSPHLWMGPGMQQTPLHFDPLENITAALHGSKYFRLYPPGALRELKPRGGWLEVANCMINRHLPAVYSELDAFLQPFGGEGRLEPLDIHLQAGDMLYLPAGWWHAVRGSSGLNATISWGFEPGDRRVAS